MITGCVFIDLTTEPDIDDESRDRRAIHVLESVPNRARVVVDIGARTYVTSDVVVFLHRHAERLLIEIRGRDPMGVEEFVRAARAGAWNAA